MAQQPSNPIRGAYNARSGWVFYIPLVGYEQSNDCAEYVRIEHWGAAAEAVAHRRNFSNLH